MILNFGVITRFLEYEKVSLYDYCRSGADGGWLREEH